MINGDLNDRKRTNAVGLTNAKMFYFIEDINAVINNNHTLCERDIFEIIKVFFPFFKYMLKKKH